ncbi:hypothetical protein [Oceanisphaera pacifica]|uniref:Uncharacterized protein n=1 Tax=Oceanisphaera pacifica TaxID=2818389 RepID=A0ABS3NGK9_9GAMM|nr:hypothetical protein [Oceanisphaera pacifica]MBO1519724.1 hypothetical protein [Oceanisphaera pacifica]
MNKDSSVSLLIVLAPILIFAVLNAYYLAQEKRFRKNYNDFVKDILGEVQEENGTELQFNSDLVSKLFRLSPEDDLKIYYLQACRSSSLLAFYGGLIVIVFLVNCIV